LSLFSSLYVGRVPACRLFAPWRGKDQQPPPTYLPCIPQTARQAPSIEQAWAPAARGNVPLACFCPSSSSSLV
jgi:hypothetical protein